MHEKHHKSHLKLQRSQNSSKLEKEWLHSAAIQSYIGRKKIIFSFGIAHWTPLNVIAFSPNSSHYTQRDSSPNVFSLMSSKTPLPTCQQIFFSLRHNPTYPKKNRAFLSIILELKQVINWSTTFFTHTTPTHNNFFWQINRIHWWKKTVLNKKSKPHRTCTKELENKQN